MECQQHEKRLLDGAGSRTPSKEQGSLGGASEESQI
jgi:hypothetical protein